MRDAKESREAVADERTRVIAAHSEERASPAKKLGIVMLANRGYSVESYDVGWGCLLWLGVR